MKKFEYTHIDTVKSEHYFTDRKTMIQIDKIPIIPIIFV